MKVAEAKEGSVSYAKTSIASGESRVNQAGSGFGNDDEIFHQLSQKEQRSLLRMSEAKRQHILDKAKRNPAERRYEEALRPPSGEKRTTVFQKRSDNNTEIKGTCGSAERMGGTADNLARPKGITGLAAAAARRTSNKVSQALKQKADQLRGSSNSTPNGDDNAAKEVSNITKPMKRIVAAVLSVLAVIFGPIIFIFLLILILIVVVIFLVAWLVSVLFSWFTSTSAGGGTGAFGMGWGSMPYYCQQDDRWGTYPFNGATLFSDGCGMTAMAMIVSYIKNDPNIIPPTIVETGYNTVSSHYAPVGIAARFEITDIEQMAGPSNNCCSVSKAYDLDYLREKINAGCPVLVSVAGSYLNIVTDGHYLALCGEGPNGVYVYDPATLGAVYEESINGGGSDWDAVMHGAKHIWIFPAPEITITGNTNAEKIFRYLVKAGWTKEAAAAAVGNFYQEAGGGGTADINPAAYDSGSWGEGGGIAGFTDNGSAGNFTRLKEFASDKGKDWTDLATQCEFLVYQMSHGVWWGAYATPTYVDMLEAGYTVKQCTYEEFTKMTDVEEATKAFLCFYEDGGLEMAHYADVRLPMAKQVLTAWG